jgi:hypothetical protein
MWMCPSYYLPMSIGHEARPDPRPRPPFAVTLRLMLAYSLVIGKVASIEPPAPLVVNVAMH